jgi:hypothetical protein
MTRFGHETRSESSRQSPQVAVGKITYLLVTIGMNCPSLAELGSGRAGLCQTRVMTPGAFTVREPFRPLAALGRVALSLPVPLVAYFFFLRPDARPPDWSLAVFAAFWLWGTYQAVRPRTLVRVGPEGVRLAGPRTWRSQSGRGDDRLIPWPSIWQVVVLTSPLGDVAGAELAVRLRRGAPIPAGVTAVVEDPGNPLAIQPQLRQSLDGVALDRMALGSAAGAYAPPDVRLVEEPAQMTA